MERSIPYFRHLLSKNVDELKRLSEEWEKHASDCSPPEQVLGDIRSTIGLARLLMRQKLSQFRGLIEDCEFKRGEKEITCIDLQGFWDMVYFEVEKIFKNFENLEKCKNNNWEVVELQPEKPELKKKLNVVPKNHMLAKSLALAARERIAEAKRKMKMKLTEQKNVDFIVEIREPSREQSNSEKEGSSLVTSDKTNSRHNHARNIRTPSIVSECTVENLLENKAVDKEKSKRKELSSHKPDSVENKENIKYIKEKDPGVEKLAKSNSKMNIKSKSCPFPVSNGKKSERCKEFIPLQCVTRSAKKALLEQQKNLHKP